MSQILDTEGTRPAFGTRLTAHTAVAAARLLTHLPPRRLRTVLGLIRKGARPAGYDEALRARGDITAVSTLCAGRYCLPRSLATALLCRLRGHWPTWCSGLRTSPFGAHAWVEAEGKPVGEPADITTYHPMVTITHSSATTTKNEASCSHPSGEYAPGTDHRLAAIHPSLPKGRAESAVLRPRVTTQGSPRPRKYSGRGSSMVPIPLAASEEGWALLQPPSWRYVQHEHPGLDEQTGTLAEFAGRRLACPRRHTPLAASRTLV